MVLLGNRLLRGWKDFWSRKRAKQRNGRQEFQYPPPPAGNCLFLALDDGAVMRILECLENPKDLARAASVCLQWHKLVMASPLWQRLCLRMSPHSCMISIAPAQHSDSDSESSSLVWQSRAFALLCHALSSSPSSAASIIAASVCASSTDNLPEEHIDRTLRPHPRGYGIRSPSYWSSRGSPNPDSNEHLIYRLASPLCVVHDFSVRPFKAYFQDGDPVYSSRQVRLFLGHRKPAPPSDTANIEAQWVSQQQEQQQGRRREDSDSEFVWTYASPTYDMEKSDRLQQFLLPSPALCIGGFAKIELIGRVQRQHFDEQYYTCVCHVYAIGRPLYDFEVRIKEGGSSRDSRNQSLIEEGANTETAGPSRQGGGGSSQQPTEWPPTAAAVELVPHFPSPSLRIPWERDGGGIAVGEPGRALSMEEEAEEVEEELGAQEQDANDAGGGGGGQGGEEGGGEEGEGGRQGFYRVGDVVVGDGAGGMQVRLEGGIVLRMGDEGRVIWDFEGEMDDSDAEDEGEREVQVLTRLPPGEEEGQPANDTGDGRGEVLFGYSSPSTNMPSSPDEDDSPSSTEEEEDEEVEEFFVDALADFGFGSSGGSQ